MRPNTSVRQPVIAGARRRHLSELLRSWRRQPRKRSPLLFASLIAVAFLLDGALAFLAIQLVGLVSQGTTPSAERRLYVPYAANAALWEPMRRWAIRVDDRLRPFENVCCEVVRRITGEERFEDNDPLAVVVSWMLHGAAWEDQPCLRCEDAELRALIYREGRSLSRLSREEQLHSRHIEPAVLHQSKSFRKMLRGIAARGGAVEGNTLSSLERQAVHLNRRLALFDHLCTAGVDGGEGPGVRIARDALREAYDSGSADLFAVAMTDFLEASRRALRVGEDPVLAQRLALENWLNEYRPYRQALYWSLVAAGLLAIATIVGVCRPLGRRGCLLSGLLACLVCLGWSIAGMVCDAILHDGTPVCQGMEGAIWIASAALALSLALALRYRDGFAALAGVAVSSVGFLLANHWPPRFVENWTDLPDLLSGDGWLRLQVLAVLSAGAALALAWSVAALALLRLVLTPPSSERLHALALRCARAVGLAMILLAASALIDGGRAMQASESWHSWSVQSLGTLLALPCCAALLYARRMGWLQPFGVLVSIALACALIAMAWQAVPLLDAGGRSLAAVLAENALVYLAGLGGLSLTVHAALRYYFGKQRILEV